MSDHNFKSIPEALEFMKELGANDVRVFKQTGIHIAEDTTIGNTVSAALYYMSEEEITIDSEMENMPSGEYEVSTIIKITRIGDCPASLKTGYVQ